MLKIKRDVNQQKLSNLNKFHSLEVVYLVSETQFQVGKNKCMI